MFVGNVVVNRIENMNFNKWWENRLKTHFAGDEGNGLDAWNACKNETLKILNNNIVPICDTQLQKDAEQFIDIEAIKEIEKL